VTSRRPRPRRRCGGKGGFTLLEILVSVTILGIALVSLLGLHARDLHLTAETQEMTTAAMLAQRLVALTKAGEIPAEGTVEGTFTSRERESLRADEIYGGEGSERFVWKRAVEPIPGLPGLWAINISVGEPDAVAAAELHFAVGNKARLAAILAAILGARGSSDDDSQ